MEEFVNVKDILVRDSRHVGYDFRLEELHRFVGSIKLDIKAPEVLHSQINVAKNMVVYLYLLYSLAHGSEMLHPACIRFVVTASELINQLYQDTNTQ